jgi:integrase
MAKNPLGTRNSRALAVAAERAKRGKDADVMLWRQLLTGLSIGYRSRRPGVPGRWVVRRYVGDAKPGSPYARVDIGRADDDPAAGGLSYDEAETLAKASAKAPAPSSRMWTVDEAMDHYLAYARSEPLKSAYDAERTANTHIRPALGHIKLDALTLDTLQKWKTNLATKPARGKPAPATDDAKRSRQATANRIMATLKSALNQAAKHHRSLDRNVWRDLEPYGRAAKVRERALSVAECEQLIAAADEASGFRNLVRAALFTGARYGELCRFVCADFAHGELHVRESKSDEERDISLNADGIAFFRDLCAGRAPDDPILRRADGTAWLKSQQALPMKKACQRAGLPELGVHQLRHTYATRWAMPTSP